MKRILPILLVLCLLLTCMTACKKQPEETQTATEEEIPTRTTSTAPPTDGIDEKDAGWSFWSKF